MAECSLLAKLALMPGCRPWDTPAPVENTTGGFQFAIPGVSTQVPYRPEETAPFTETGVSNIIQTTVSKISANASRLFSSSTSGAVNQGEAPLAWYDLTGRIGQTASSVNEAFQSTLIKVIILVVLVGVIALFGMSYVQSKGVQLAK